MNNTIQTKLEEIQAEMQQVAEAHSKLTVQRDQAAKRFSELEGARSILIELSNVDTDTDTDAA